jgi:hypothetical protein
MASGSRGAAGNAGAARRDVYVSNDSGALSVIPSSALDRIIADGRENDLAIVRDHQALLLLLAGDDSFPARGVARAVREGRLAIDRSQRGSIGYLVQLRPFEPGSALSELSEDAWFAQETGVRVPPRCPVGLATEIADPEVDSLLARLARR